MRTLMICFAIGLAACAPVRDDNALMAEESGALRCHTSETVYTNHTGNGRDLHVRLTDNCISIDTIRVPTAHIRILNQTGGLVQDVEVGSGETHRGTFTVPAGGSLQLVCPEGFSASDGCPWRYSY